MPRKILLADDSVTAQNMGKKILSDAGYEVITVSNGSAALKKVNELLPDIVVLDVYMPGYSGLEVCKLLRENSQTADIPILLTVGKLEPFKSDEAVKAKANAFVVKPFEATELLAVIQKIEEATSKAERKASKTPKGNPLARVFSSSAAVEAPDPDGGIEEKGWKNRLSMPGKQKAEPESEEEEAPTMGTAFRDLTPAPVEESGLRRNSAFTADAVAANAPPEAPLDISPEEIAAIKAAVKVLSGEEERAPVLHVAAVEEMPRQLVPEPEETVEDFPAESAGFPETKQDVVKAPLIEVAATPKTETSVAVVAPVQAHWAAEPMELTQADAVALLESEMQEALKTSSASEKLSPAGLASSAESTVAGPVDDEPIASELVAAGVAADFAAHSAATLEPTGVLAVAARASGDGSTSPSPGMAAPVGSQDLGPVAWTATGPVTVAGQGSAPDIARSGAPDPVPGNPSAPEDEIDSRTKSQMDAAWSNWHEIRNTLVTPNLTEQLAAVAAASAQEEMSQQPLNSEAAAYDSASIANIVDSVLAEMRPKLVEEIAKKLAAKKK